MQSRAGVLGLRYYTYMGRGLVNASERGGRPVEWSRGIQDAIHYIEDHITEELEYTEIAKRAYVSCFHFQRIFSILCGYTLGEYIRNRRLTLAGLELISGNAKVIDVALKCCYDSPDSFTKAFTRFHGLTPSSVKNKGASLKSVAPLKIKLTLEGGNTMEYTIMEKDTITVIGTVREFNTETSYAEIPKFWSEHYQSGNGKYVCGMFGICFNDDGECKTFSYMIADCFDAGKEFPEGFVTKTIPAATWAVFPCRGAMPKALQDVNSKIWNEWLPNCREYVLAGDYNIEMYSDGDTASADYYSEIWIPVKKA